VVDATMAMVTKHGIKWSRDKEVTRVGRTVNSAIKNLLMRDYDPAAGCAPDWLHPEYHDQWLDVLATGHVPSLRRNAHVFFVSPGKQFAETAASDNSAPEPTNSAPEPTNPTPEPRKAKNPGVFVLPRTMPFDYGTLEGLPWLYGDHYMRRTVSGTVAPGGTGKSSLTLGETIVMAWAQRAVLGELPLERMRVWYHSGEEPMEILKLRVAAFCIHHGIPLEEILPEWLILTTKSEFPFKVAEG
jgi:hypothetical protein